MIPPRVRKLRFTGDSRPSRIGEFQILGLPHRVSLWLVLLTVQRRCWGTLCDGNRTGREIELPPGLDDDLKQYLVDSECGIGQGSAIGNAQRHLLRGRRRIDPPNAE